MLRAWLRRLARDCATVWSAVVLQEDAAVCTCSGEGEEVVEGQIGHLGKRPTLEEISRGNA